jgi:hypothetical protein
MPPLQGYATTDVVDTEIVAAYAAANQRVPGVAAAPGWTSIGSFFLPKTVKARLDVIAISSDPALAVTARLYDPATGIPVSGSNASAASLTGVDTRLLGGVISLAGNQVWGIEVQAVGSAATSSFVTVRTAGLVSP